jgi:hypothetical protein
MRNAPEGRGFRRMRGIRQRREDAPCPSPGRMMVRRDGPIRQPPRDPGTGRATGERRGAPAAPPPRVPAPVPARRGSGYGSGAPAERLRPAAGNTPAQAGTNQTPGGRIMAREQFR